MTIQCIRNSALLIRSSVRTHKPQLGDFFNTNGIYRQLNQTYIVEQVLAQVKAVFHLGNITQRFAVPLAIKRISSIAQKGQTELTAATS